MTTDNELDDQSDEYFGTGPKKGRGRAEASLDLIEAMYEIAEECQPITGRGVGYKLFTARLIDSMSTKARVSSKTFISVQGREAKEKKRAQARTRAVFDPDSAPPACEQVTVSGF